MSLPNYRIQLDVCIRKPIEAQSIWLRQVRNLPFVPRDGDTIRLTSEDGEDTFDIQLDGVVYDASEGYFVVDTVDETACENYADHGTCDETEVVAAYTHFGFIRVTFPVGQVVKP